ncbi:protein of unknown function [Methylocella tundrae]|uniref:Uncharacterized protein n=1 Tax=Methylocella tundrae TaxID=227605 RepID=A0A4U8Z1P5_METTU|nr:protein of unknown function [Methylocella tundrae]
MRFALAGGTGVDPAKTIVASLKQTAGFARPEWAAGLMRGSLLRRMGP